jgi:hypothetical protein
MRHFLDSYPILRLIFLVVMAIFISFVVHRGYRYGYVPMQLYSWRRKTDPFIYWCFIVLYCIAALGLWLAAAQTALELIQEG